MPEPRTEFRPPRAIYDVLVRAIAPSEGEDIEVLHDKLHDAYVAFSTGDSDLIARLSRFQTDGKISADDKMYLFVLFNTAKNIGPYNLGSIRLEMLEPNPQPTSLLEKIDGLVMDITLKDYLSRMVRKIYPE